jgi:hypothetical protein
VIVGTVLLCPELDGRPPEWAAAVADRLTAAGLVAYAPELAPADPTDDARTAAAHWVGRLAIAIGVASPPPPLLLVLTGDCGSLAAAVGFSQRAARRAVGGYALVDAACPAPGGEVPDWPDAPVSYLASPAAVELQVGQARLRGWRLVPLATADGEQVAAALLALVAG